MRNLLLCLTLMLLSSVAYSSNTIRISTGEYTPYCSSSVKHKGFASHVISEAFARVGYTVEYDFLPWKRAKKQAKNGEYDATSWWAYSEERAKDFLYSDELLRSSIHFFYMKGHNYDFDWKSFDDLKKYRIGVSRSYHYSDEFTAYRKANSGQFEVVNDDEQNFRRLLRGRTDIFPIDTVVGLELLRTKFGPNVIHQVSFHPRPIASRQGFLMFPKANARSDELRKAFNKGLKMMREDGTYDRMFDDLLSGYYSN